MDSTENTGIMGDQDITESSNQTPPETPQVELEEEQEPVATSPAKSPISSLHASDFYNPEEF